MMFTVSWFGGRPDVPFMPRFHAEWFIQIGFRFSLLARFDYAMDNGMEFTSITNYLNIDKFSVDRHLPS